MYKAAVTTGGTLQVRYHYDPAPLLAQCPFERYGVTATRDVAVTHRVA